MVGLGLSPAGQPPDVVAGQVVTDEGGLGVVSVNGCDLELELDVHLGEVPGQVLDGDLDGTSDDVLGVGGGGLSDLGLVEHAGRVDLVPLFRLPLVLHLAACYGLDFLCGCHVMTPLTAVGIR